MRGSREREYARQIIEQVAETAEPSEPTLADEIPFFERERDLIPIGNIKHTHENYVRYGEQAGGNSLFYRLMAAEQRAELALYDLLTAYIEALAVEDVARLAALAPDIKLARQRVAVVRIVQAARTALGRGAYVTLGHAYAGNPFENHNQAPGARSALGTVGFFQTIKARVLEVAAAVGLEAEFLDALNAELAIPPHVTANLARWGVDLPTWKPGARQTVASDRMLFYLGLVRGKE